MDDVSQLVTGFLLVERRVGLEHVVSLRGKGRRGQADGEATSR